MPGEIVLVKRDLDVITIPYGTRMTLPAGSQIRVAQAFGGNYTVVTDQGTMVRIEAKDADAIGETAGASVIPGGTPGEFSEKAVWDQLRTVYDPEIPVNIVDLGLVYECAIAALDGDRKKIDIKMTMTAPGCGMGDVLKQDVERKVGGLPGVGEVHVEVVFDPPWNMSRLSDAAKLQLGLM